MIHSQIKIHDRYRLEMKLSYALSRKEKLTVYDIEAYFFLPNNLDVNNFSYSKDDFYKDMLTHIRFSTPIFSLDSIVSKKDCPFEKVKDACQKVIKSSYSRKDITQFESQIKMFGAIMKSALRDHIKLIRNSRNQEEMESLLNQYIKSVQDIKRSINQLALENKSNGMKKNVSQRYLFIAEYVSLNIEYQTYQAIMIFNKKEILCKQTCLPELYKLISDEINYRKKNNCSSIIQDKGDNEEFLHRFGILKKYASSILYLNTRYKKEGILLEHIVLGFSAAIAMVIFTLTAFTFQQVYGSFTLPLFMALVVGYIFKDRVKDISRYYFSGKLDRALFDYGMSINSDKKNKIGINREDFEFISNDSLSRDILQIRNKQLLRKLETESVGENIMLYRKHIEIHSKKIKKFHQDLATWGITDISRFNVGHIIRHMDNPFRTLYKLGKDGQSMEFVEGAKVYYVDMVIKYSMKPENMYRYYRLVLNRDGIKRIEELN